MDEGVQPGGADPVELAAADAYRDAVAGLSGWPLNQMYGSVLAKMVAAAVRAYEGEVDQDFEVLESTFVGLIASRRKALRLSMQKAADIAGVHRLTWSAWENGRARPESYNHAGIDAALRLPSGTTAGVVVGESTGE